MLDSSCLFYFAWPRVSSGSDGLYLSPLSDMSPVTSDCVWDTRFSLLDWVRVAGLSCAKGVWYIYDWDTG